MFTTIVQTRCANVTCIFFLQCLGVITRKRKAPVSIGWFAINIDTNFIIVVVKFLRKSQGKE